MISTALFILLSNLINMAVVLIVIFIFLEVLLGCKDSFSDALSTKQCLQSIFVDKGRSGVCFPFLKNSTRDTGWLLFFFDSRVQLVQYLLLIMIIFWMSSTHIGELLLQGPVFVKEPSNSIFPVGSEDEKITLNCEARGNPSPHYRYSGKSLKIHIKKKKQFGNCELIFFASVYLCYQ